MNRRIAPVLAVAALAGVVSLASPAPAAPADKSQVLSGWTQTSAAGQNSWIAARQSQSAWSSYGFDWSTDYCSSSPDNPLGFPFETSCARHDFGYRNYKAAGSFAANKDRLDSAFYADLKRVCAAYSGVKRTTCDATAWTYYQAVSALGSSVAVDGSATVRGAGSPAAH
ncbi:phospholipase [Streptomyces sp. NPDC005263]|uniref:phospholipase n=1 Tax=Streptomyces sp. NPDC005263 TaxID=3364711 RepID=UPI003677A434